MLKILTIDLKQVIIFMLLVVSVSLLNASFYTSLYSDHKSFSIGDILTVNISESSKASSSSQSNTEKSMNTSLNVQAGQGPLDFIPLSGMGGSSSNNYKGDANTSRDASLSAKMTVTIVDIDSTGNLMIKGSRVVTINGEDEITTLEGIVRSQDVGADNTIYSYNIADAKISYKGKGAVNDGSKVGLISRIFNFIF